MKISPSIVRIKKIVSSKARTDFSETDLDEAAKLILEMEGVVMPLILLRTEPESESYSVIDGHFEYYAALRAKEIDSRKGSTINAYIVESEEEKQAYEQQVKVFRQRQSVLPTAPEVSPIPPPDVIASPINTPEVSPIPAPDVKASATSPSESVVSDERFAALEQRFTQLVAKNDKLVVTNDALEKTVAKLAEAKDNWLHETLETFKHFFGEQFNNFSVQIEQKVDEQIKALGEQMKIVSSSRETPEPSAPIIAQVPERFPPLQEPVSLAEPPASVKPVQPLLTPVTSLISSVERKFLEEINTLPIHELTLKLGRLLDIVGLKNKKTEVINRLESERKKRAFTSIQEMIKRLKGTGLGKRRLEKVLELWD